MTQQPPARPTSENPSASAAADPAQDASKEEAEPGGQLLFQYVPSWLTSFVLHISVVILLALIPILVQEKKP